jgi:hypothetical protein
MESFLSRRKNGTAGIVSEESDRCQWVYPPSAIQMPARPAKAKTEVNFMLTCWKQEDIDEGGKRLLRMLTLFEMYHNRRCDVLTL